jgi:hypothetical protein
MTQILAYLEIRETVRFEELPADVHNNEQASPPADWNLHSEAFRIYFNRLDLRNDLVARTGGRESSVSLTLTKDRNKTKRSMTTHAAGGHMNFLKSIGALALVTVGFVLLIFLADVFISGTAQVSVWLLPILSEVGGYTFLVCLFLLLPMAMFRRTRFVSAIGLFAASYIFGAETWIIGFLLTYAFWGAVGIFVGLMIAGIGVVPLALIALAIHKAWEMAGELLLWVILTFGCRFAAVYIGEKTPQPIASAVVD